MNCYLDIGLPGCNCPEGHYRDGDKCRKNEDCLPLPKGNMLKLNKLVSQYYKCLINLIRNFKHFALLVLNEDAPEARKCKPIRDSCMSHSECCSRSCFDGNCAWDF